MLYYAGVLKRNRQCLGLGIGRLSMLGRKSVRQMKKNKKRGRPTVPWFCKTMRIPDFAVPAVKELLRKLKDEKLKNQ